MILAPSHFSRVSFQIRAGDMVVSANFRATQARKEALGLVRASLAVAVALLMVDALREVEHFEPIPTRRFVGVDRGVRVDTAFDCGDGLGFAVEHEGQRPTIALAHDDDDAALAVLVFGKAAVDPVFLVIGGLQVAAEIGAVHFDRAVHGHVLLLRL